MAEPNTSIATIGLVAGMAAFLGPLAGPYAVIIVFGVGGGLVAASRATTPTVGATVGYGFRGGLFAAALAVALSDWLEHHFGLGAHALLAPVALLIGLFAHRWAETWTFARAIVSRSFTKGARDAE